MVCYKQQKNELMQLKFEQEHKTDDVHHERQNSSSSSPISSESTPTDSEDINSPNIISLPQILGDYMDDMHNSLDMDNKLHPCWNMYDWYNKETTLQVIDDILCADAEDKSIKTLFNSLRDQHGYIHEALINNEWNIWQFVQECKYIDNYGDALQKLLDEHPRVYAAIHAEELLNELNDLNQNINYIIYGHGHDNDMEHDQNE